MINIVWNKNIFKNPVALKPKRSISAPKSVNIRRLQLNKIMGIILLLISFKKRVFFSSNLCILTCRIPIRCSFLSAGTGISDNQNNLKFPDYREFPDSAYGNGHCISIC